MDRTAPSRLVMESGDHKGMILPLRGRAVTIGRGPDNTIQIIDTRISRMHSRLEDRGGYWTIEDVQSRNGTRINSQPISGRVRLASGDIIEMGKTVFLFESLPAGPPEESLAMERVLEPEQNADEIPEEHEFELARSIQIGLLPSSMPEIAGYEIGGLSRPAPRPGGDLFDIMELPEGGHALFIIDVSGKAMAAATLLTATRAAARIEARRLARDGAARVLSRLNDALCRDSASDSFVSMVLAHFDPEHRRLAYCNAGHVNPIVRAPEGDLHGLAVGGALLGVMPGIELEEASIELPPGSLTVFLTDGVRDARNPEGEAFGQDRIEAWVRNHADLPAQPFCDGLDREIREFQGPADPIDDLTVMALKAV